MRTLIPKATFAIPDDYNVINPGLNSLIHGIPWIATEAALFLNTWLKGHENVLDIGIGGSTIFYAARSKTVVGLEVITPEGAAWKGAVSKAIEGQELKNIELSFVNSEKALVEELHKLPLYSFDLISVDTFHTVDREKVLKEALTLLRPTGLIVMDNFRDGAMWFKTCALSPEDFLKYYRMPNHTVHDFFELGWVGNGTRLVIPTN